MMKWEDAKEGKEWSIEEERKQVKTEKGKKIKKESDQEETTKYNLHVVPLPCLSLCVGSFLWDNLLKSFIATEK